MANLEAVNGLKADSLFDTFKRDTILYMDHETMFLSASTVLEKVKR